MKSTFHYISNLYPLREKMLRVDVKTMNERKHVGYMLYVFPSTFKQIV